MYKLVHPIHINLMAEPTTILSSSPTTQQPPLQDRIAIVTGGFGGIGQAIVLHLASLGVKLIIADLTTSTLPLTLSQTHAFAFKIHISDPNQVKSLFDFAEATFNSPAHILVNCAGVADPTFSTISTTSLETFDKIMSINTRGTFLCCKEGANRLKKVGGGRIICVTSSQVAALKPGYGTYTASKATVEVIVKIMAMELKGTGITANCVAPGPITTEMFFTGKTDEMIQKVIDLNPSGRLGTSDDIAPVVGFLAGESSDWINGQVIRVNGGYV